MIARKIRAIFRIEEVEAASANSENGQTIRYL
jgi:hypothetical protein